MISPLWLRLIFTQNDVFGGVAETRLNIVGGGGEFIGPHVSIDNKLGYVPWHTTVLGKSCSFRPPLFSFTGLTS